ncbi:PREDICTED: LOC18790585 [Prunus dulcis]|uniref:PREDICTED: LOC18790585 n=1 Tax=Prunus dulcis TaxID=3755 RepID=A0A5E4F8T0_PRUDU|nr:PREDICTED: LOC18790585 [Prunus dulcis]
MENDNNSDMTEESGVTNQDSISLPLEALQAISDLNKSTMEDEGSILIMSEEIVGRDHRTGLEGEAEQEESPNVSWVLLGRSEEEVDVNSKSLNPSEIAEKEHADSQFWFIGRKKATSVLSVLKLVNSMSLNPHLDSDISDSEGVKKDLDFEFIIRKYEKQMVGLDHHNVKSVFFNDKMVGSDEILGSLSVCGKEKTDQQDLNNLVPEFAEKENIGFGSGSSSCRSEGVEAFEFIIKRKDVMRAHHLELEGIGLKKEVATRGIPFWHVNHEIKRSWSVKIWRASLNGITEGEDMDVDDPDATESDSDDDRDFGDYIGNEREDDGDEGGVDGQSKKVPVIRLYQEEEYICGKLTINDYHNAHQLEEAVYNLVLETRAIFRQRYLTPLTTEYILRYRRKNSPQNWTDLAIFEMDWEEVAARLFVVNAIDNTEDHLNHYYLPVFRRSVDGASQKIGDLYPWDYRDAEELERASKHVLSKHGVLDIMEYSFQYYGEGNEELHIFELDWQQVLQLDLLSSVYATHNVPREGDGDDGV